MRWKTLTPLVLISPAVAIGSFQNPSGQDGDHSYHPNQVVPIQWMDTADYNSLSLGYYSSHNATVTWLISNSPNYPTRYSWTVKPVHDGFNFEEDDQFYMRVINANDSQSAFTSPMFYIRRRSDPEPTETTPTGTPTPTSDTPTGTSTVGEGGTGSGEQGNKNGGVSSALSTGAKAGIGVGATIGGLIVIAVIAFLVLRRRKNLRVPETELEAPLSERKKESDVDESETPTLYSQSQSTPVEIPTTPYKTRQELSDHVHRVELE